jgi:hypothetical protein
MVPVVPLRLANGPVLPAVPTVNSPELDPAGGTKVMVVALTTTVPLIFTVPTAPVIGAAKALVTPDAKSPATPTMASTPLFHNSNVVLLRSPVRRGVPSPDLISCSQANQSTFVFSGLCAIKQVCLRTAMVACRRKPVEK